MCETFVMLSGSKAVRLDSIISVEKIGKRSDRCHCRLRLADGQEVEIEESTEKFLKRCKIPVIGLSSPEDSTEP